MMIRRREVFLRFPFERIQNMWSPRGNIFPGCSSRELDAIRVPNDSTVNIDGDINLG